MEIKFEELDNYEIDEFDNVFVTTTAPHLKKVTYLKGVNTEPRIRNIDRDHYKDLRSGKIKKKKHTKKRIDNKASLRSTRRDLIDIINTNVVDLYKCKFITLTYKDVMNDTKVFDKDVNLFVKNFNYRYKCKKNIKVCVPQLRGSYHAHIIFIFDDVAPYIEREELNTMWKNGTAYVEKVYGDVDNLGVYLSSQFSDVPLEDMKKYNIPYNEKDVKCVEVINGEELDKTRYFVKYGIANIIPPGFRILRTSRNLVKPTKEKLKYYELREKVGYRNPTYKKSLKLIVESDDTKRVFENIIVKEYYNLRRFSPVVSPNDKDLEALDFIDKSNSDDERYLKIYEESKISNPDNYDF